VKPLAAVVAAAFVAASGGPATAAPSQSPSSYPSCGKYREGFGNPFTSQLRADVCIVSAWREGRKARLVVISSTVEGDPIVTYVFVNGGRPVLVVVDATRDDFGPRVWMQRRCDRIDLRDGSLALERCRTLRRGKPSWLKPAAIGG
jgi:hypothetical protein